MHLRVQPQELGSSSKMKWKKENENRYYISLQFGYGYLKNEEGMPKYSK